MSSPKSTSAIWRRNGNSKARGPAKESAVRMTAVGLLIALLFSSSASLALDKIRVGLSSITATNGAVWVAEERGLFRKHGFEAEIIVIGGGAARGVSALIARDIQFVAAAGDAVIHASLKGADVVMVASILNKGVQRVVARPELRSAEELKGKRIGITRYGSASHLVLQMMLRKWRMNPGELQLLQIGSSPAMLASLDRGGIDAAVLSIPAVFVAEDAGYRVLADLADMDIFYLHTMLSTTQSYIRTNRDQATRFVKAFVEGIAYFKKNKKESLGILKKKLRMEVSQEKFLERTYDILAAKYYDQVPYPSLQGVKTVLEFQAKESPKAKEADPQSFIDSSIVKELETSGFIKALY